MKIFHFLILPVFLLAACNEGKTDSMGTGNETSVAKKIIARRNILVEESASIIKDTVSMAENAEEEFVATDSEIVRGKTGPVKDTKESGERNALENFSN